MNLKDRMNQNNRNNSSILNNSDFDFNGNKQGYQQMIYDKSRKQCQQQLLKRKKLLQNQKYTLSKSKQKDLNMALQKFHRDFEQKKQYLLTQLNQSLEQIKKKYQNQIRQHGSIQTQQQARIKASIEELLTKINSNLMGLKKDHYRQYIAKIVTTDFDTDLNAIREAIKKLKTITPQATFGQKAVQCMRTDINRAIVLNISNRKIQGSQQQQYIIKRPQIVNTHPNRDLLKGQK